MNLKEQIEKDFISAYKSKDDSLDVLKMIKSSIKNAEITKKDELTNEEILKVLIKEKKQREDSVIEFKKGNRTDLADNEKKEIKIIEKYLPVQIDRTEIESIVKKTVEEMNAFGIQDMGKVMKIVMEKLAGQADGNIVSEIVKKQLNQ
jgi:uncharacterized protein YqeY